MAKKVTKTKSVKAKKSTTRKTNIENIYSTFGIIILLFILCIIMGVGFFLIPRNNDVNLGKIFSNTVKETVLYTVEVNPKRVQAKAPEVPIVENVEIDNQVESIDGEKQTSDDEVDQKNDNKSEIIEDKKEDIIN